MKYLRIQDQLGKSGPAMAGALSPSDFSGKWTTTNPDNPSVVSVTCTAEGKVLRVRLEGNGSSEPSDFGEATAELLCAASINGGPAMSFLASFDLGFKKVLAGANLNQDLLIISSYHSFQNGEGRSSYYVREFFHRAEQRD
jgi:hypothetical protein